MRVRMLAMFGCLVVGAAQAEAASFQNGSFELSTIPNSFGFTTLNTGSPVLTGWEILGSIDYINTHWQAADGNRSVDLTGNSAAGGEIRQTFDTIAGTSYLVQFALSGNPDGLPVTKTMTVQSGGFSQVYLFSTVGTSRQNMGWIYESFLFTATSDLSTLSFISGPANGTFFGPALDDVSVTAVPEPASLALLGSGVAAAFARRRRTR